MIKSNFQNSHNILSLSFNNEDMAKAKDQAYLSEPARWGPIKMPKRGMQPFCLGGSDRKYFIWNSFFHKEMKATNWDQAKTEGYKIVCDYCKENKLAPPPNIF